MRLSHPHFGLVLTMFVALYVSGCAAFKKLHLPAHRPAQPAATPAPVKPQVVGTITLVNEDAHFVLIDVGASGVPRSGTALKAMSGGAETGVVTVGEVRRRPFVVADIVRGAPRKGDRVFQ
jgi:hypothetical protein